MANALERNMIELSQLVDDLQETIETLSCNEYSHSCTDLAINLTKAITRRAGLLRRLVKTIRPLIAIENADG